jgi:succinate dehydrogenase / fumarate reductase cytochrome b subunit
MMQSPRARPLSPHIQIYKWQITSVLSIIHRFTGIVLCGGLIGFIAWLYLLSLGANDYTFWMEFFNIPLGQIFLWSVIFSLNYHFINGLRHLAWDKGWGFTMKDVNKNGYFVVIFTFAITMLMFVGWR